jgi:hypothetical protein
MSAIAQDTHPANAGRRFRTRRLPQVGANHTQAYPYPETPGSLGVGLFSVANATHKKEGCQMSGLPDKECSRRIRA